jgi:hypothetical protein
MEINPLALAIASSENTISTIKGINSIPIILQIRNTIKI